MTLESIRNQIINTIFRDELITLNTSTLILCSAVLGSHDICYGILSNEYIEHKTAKYTQCTFSRLFLLKMDNLAYRQDPDGHGRYFEEAQLIERIRNVTNVLRGQLKHVTALIGENLLK